MLDRDSNFYFLEMNTRLQVEHPITEIVTQTDLVELQIKIASGEKLDINQSDIIQTGHAIECRLYAEDPDNNFLPSIGVLGHIGPGTMDGVRYDGGFVEGNEVTINFDPMLAKIIGHGANRDEAIVNMNKALNNYLFCGVKTNRDYLRRILFNNNFINGITYTSFVETNADALAVTELSTSQKAEIIATLINHQRAQKINSAWVRLAKYNKSSLYLNEKLVEFTSEIGTNNISITIAGDRFSFTESELGSTFVYDDKFNDHRMVYINGAEALITGDQLERSKAVALEEGSLVSPMPGKIFKVYKNTGEKVVKGDTILILEAMKMEHPIKANCDGVIKEIFFDQGTQVQGGSVLVEVDEA
jgi:acetyl/propionyl-CoA carboxylase alpha subunit